MKVAYLGCDPGAKGYICLLVPEDGHVEFVSNTDKPVDIFQWLIDVNLHYKVRISMIEDVHSLYGMSAKSNFSFGFNTGRVSALLEASGIGLDKVAPKKWQKFVGVKATGKAIKKDVGEIADRLYPHVTIRGPRGGLDDGKADSLMIAHYTYLNYK